MEWLARLNQAIDYIENNLDGSISYDKAAQIACCSTYYFQRMFSYIAGVPLSEYIRRRRMTKAAFELLTTDMKVMDIALKYDYESPTSFNRAFQSVHGVSSQRRARTGNRTECVSTCQVFNFGHRRRECELQNRNKRSYKNCWG